MLLSGTSWAHVPKQDQVPAYSLFLKEIQKSPLDECEYRIIELENGLRATLVHDAAADNAAASLEVAVGHLSDPDDMPGLAHFTEHLLFLGTEHFPKENEYKEFLAKNNGYTSAYTSTSTTKYTFGVDTTSLEGALSRFAAFFHCPLFSPSCTSREPYAVNSENTTNLQSDQTRLFQLGKHLSKPGHPWSKFGTGNKETLLKAAGEVVNLNKFEPYFEGNESDATQDTGGPIGQESRRRVIEWWKETYCASRMQLCVIGQESIDDLSRLVTRLFSPIPNVSNLPIPKILDHPMGLDELGTLVRVQAITEHQSLEISFPLEDPVYNLTYRPASFLAHFMDHEGPGSLHSYLTKKKWITFLSGGPESLANDFASFIFRITLTEEGFMHYTDILITIFQYISLLRNSVFEPYHRREMNLLSEIDFHSLERSEASSYAAHISTHANLPIPEELLLYQPKIMLDWDDSPQSLEAQMKVKLYLDSFRMHNCRVFLVAKKDMHGNLSGAPSSWASEPWYGTQYHVERFSKDLLLQAETSPNSQEFFLPRPNQFIPTNFDIDMHLVEEHSKRPFLIRKTPGSVLWHKKDDQFCVPKVNITVIIRSPLDTSVKASVMRTLYACLIEDALAEYAYDATLAGLDYSIAAPPQGFTINLFGYNDKLPLLLSQILKHIKSCKFSPERLPIIKEAEKRDWENFFLTSPHTLADHYIYHILSEKAWTPEENLSILREISAEDIQSFAVEVLSRAELRILVNGNIDAPAAIQIAEMIENGLGLEDIPGTESIDPKCILLREGQNATYTSQTQSPDEINSALSYYVHFGAMVDQRLHVVSTLLTSILEEPAFSILRTNEQLGYIVDCSTWVSPGSTEEGMRIAVQGEKHPVYLEERVEAFLYQMEGYIQELDEEAFQDHKHGLKQRWMADDASLADESNRFDEVIVMGHWNFLRDWNAAHLVDDIGKDEVLKLFMRCVHPSSIVRSKISIHIVSQKCHDARNIPEGIEIIKDIKEFRKTLEVATSPISCIEWGDLAEAKTPL